MDARPRLRYQRGSRGVLKSALFLEIYFGQIGPLVKKYFRGGYNVTGKPRVCVVGSCNTDLVSHVPRMPAIGETLHGSSFYMGFGGKGANQAVMAAQLGADVSMIAKLGEDSFGRSTIENFRSRGVDTTHVHFTGEASSGVASIAVGPDGDNSIVIVAGANDLLTADEIENARSCIASADVLVCQLEIPLEVSLKALSVAKEEGLATIFNPAPAKEEIPEEIYGLSDVFCLNETETAILTGMTVETDGQAEAAALSILERGSGTVVVTLGERGGLVVDANSARRIDAKKVKAVDSTGAGDAFVGSLAFYTACGRSLAEAADLSCRIATRSVLAKGAQASFPAGNDLDGA